MWKSYYPTLPSPGTCKMQVVGEVGKSKVRVKSVRGQIAVEHVKCGVWGDVGLPNDGAESGHVYCSGVASLTN